MRIELTLARRGRVRAEVYDVTGTRVHSIEDRVEPAGLHVWGWNADDAEGRRVAQGLYFLRVDGPDGVSIRRIAVLDR